MITDHWFRYNFIGVRQHATTWTIVDLDACRYNLTMPERELMLSYCLYTGTKRRFSKEKSEDYLSNGSLLHLHMQQLIMTQVFVNDTMAFPL